MIAVKGFSCPSDPSAPPGNVTSTSTVYYTNSSYNYSNLATTSYAINHSVVQFGTQSLINAMSNGTSNTVLFGERYQICDLQADGNETISAWAAYFGDNNGTDGNLKFNWCGPIFNNPVGNGTTPSGAAYAVGNSGKPAATGSSYNPTLAFQNRPTSGWTSNSNCDYQILQTPHTGVLIAGLGDGSVAAFPAAFPRRLGVMPVTARTRRPSVRLVEPAPPRSGRGSAVSPAPYLPPPRSCGKIIWSRPRTPRRLRRMRSDEASARPGFTPP